MQKYKFIANRRFGVDKKEKCDIIIVNKIYSRLYCNFDYISELLFKYRKEECNYGMVQLMVERS